MEADTVLVSVLLAVVTAAEAEPPIATVTAALAASVREVIEEVSSALTMTAPTVVVRSCACAIYDSTWLSIRLVAIAAATETDAPARPNEAATETAATS